MPFADRDVLCASCGVMFVFSAGEQQFFHEKGFTNDPKHCVRTTKGSVESKRTSSAQSAELAQLFHSSPLRADL